MKQGIRWGLYTLGMLVLALGLTLNTKTGLGVSPIISVAFGVSEIWGLNFGDLTFLLYGLFVAGQIALRRGRGWLTDLLQLPLSLVFSRVLNVYSAVIPYRCEAHSLWENLLLLAAVAERLGRDQGFGKNLVDVCCVALTCVIGLTAEGRVVGVGLGTVAAMVCVGRVIALVNRLGRDWMCAAAGLVPAGRGDAPAAP